ncbi:MAG: 6-carboxytetrahydropterin synthase [Planctomycetota bacterium]
MPITCSKTYPDIPLAHRQPNHDGHCRFIHGHSWTIRVTFAAERLNEHGFVVDFGKLKYLKAWIDEHLDHGILLAVDDHAAIKMIGEYSGLFKPYYVDRPSCEGLAEEVYDEFIKLLREHEGDRVRITRVEVWEDPGNMTAFVPDLES